MKTQTQGTSIITAETYSFGELNSEERRDDVSVQFQYPYYNTEFDMQPAITTGGATATVQGGYLKLLSGAGGSVITPTKNSIRYRPGHGGYGQFTASFNGAGTGYAGVGLVGVDGFFLKVANGAVSMCIFKGGVETFITDAVNNFLPFGEVDISTIDWTKMEILRVKFGYLGVASPIFEIKQGEWKTLGMIETEGKLDEPHVNNPVLPISFGAYGVMEVRCASLNGGKLGNSDLIGSRPFEVALSVVVPASGVVTAGVFLNKPTYKGVTNRVRAKLLRYNITIDAPASGYGTIETEIIINAVHTGTPDYVDVDTDNSIMATDLVQDYESGGRVIFTEYSQYATAGGQGAKTGTSLTQDAGAFGLYLRPNETATVILSNVNTNSPSVVTARIVFNWIELF